MQTSAYPYVKRAIVVLTMIAAAISLLSSWATDTSHLFIIKWAEC